MAHNTSKVAKVLDFINREGFEWLMHPMKNYRRYQTKYPGNYAGARYFTRLFFTTVFTLIPVIPAFYVASRTLTAFSEVRANPIKTVFMATVAAGLGFGVYFFASLSATALTAMVSSAVPGLYYPVLAALPSVLAVVGVTLPPVGLMLAASGIILSVGFALAGALGFYGAKSAAQAINSYNSYRFDGLTSTSKHQLPKSEKAEDNLEAVQNIYNDILRAQKALKEEAVTIPAEKNKTIARMNEDVHVPHGVAVERTVEEGKQLLAGLESIVAKSHERALIGADYNSVLGDRECLFFSYKSKVDLINKSNQQNNYVGEKPGLSLASAESGLGTIFHSATDSKIKRMNFG